jgi:hypothetical protein
MAAGPVGHRRARSAPTPARGRLAWRRWRRSRPFWAGVPTIAAGVVVLVVPGGNLDVLLLPGVAGISGFLFGAALCALGLFFWFQPRSRSFVGIAVVLVSIGALVATNLGGFVLGTLLGIVGGALGFAWTPHVQTHGRRSVHAVDETG